MDAVPEQLVHEGHSVNLVCQKVRSEGNSSMEFLEEPICYTFS